MAQLLKLKGGEVVIDRRRDEGGVPLDLLATVLSSVVAAGQFIKQSVDLGRVVGAATCVLVGLTDQFVAACRPGKAWPTRFVLDRIAEPTSFVTVLLSPRVRGQIDGPYNLIASYFGEAAPPEVEDDRAFEREEKPDEARQTARTFWRRTRWSWGRTTSCAHSVSASRFARTRSKACAVVRRSSASRAGQIPDACGQPREVIQKRGRQPRS